MDIDLKGMIYGASIAFKCMKDQEKGCQIYNIEGYDSNDAMMAGYRFVALLNARRLISREL